MNFLQIAGRDIKTIFKNRLIRVSVIAIIIVPLLYSLLYLDAFWDPYSKLESMPVAVVNLDKGTVVDGKNVNYGDGVVDNLRDNNTVGWKFVSQEEANRGLEGNDYYAIFLITDDFSEKVVSAKEGTPKTASLKFICNEKKNFLAAQVNSKVQSALKEKIVSTITNNYVKVSFDSLYESKDGFTKAADGSKQITDGLNTLNGKVPELADGVKQLNDGSIRLYNGQVELSNGLAELNGKIPEISNGAPLLYDGSTRLANGTQELYSAYTTEIYPSVQKLTEGAKMLAGGVSAKNEDIATLTAGSNELIQSKALIDGGSTSIKTNYSTVAAGINQYIQASTQSSKSISDNLTVALNSDEATRKAIIQGIINQINANSNPNSEAAKSTQQLVQGVNDLNTGIGTFDTKLKDYTTGVNGVASGTNKLITTVQGGTSSLYGGLNKLQTELPKKFGPGLNEANSGAHTLNSKLETLNGKVPELSSGVSKLYNGSKELVDGQGKSKDGLNKLNGKVPDLKDGVTKLYDGSSELTKALQEGSNKLGSGLINSSQDMADFVSAPVEMKIDPINAVPDYGTGFSPYFMNLSLWIGAIMMFFVISPKTDEYEGTSRIHKALGKFFSYSFIGVLQAVLVGVAVLLLGLAPENIGLYFLMLIFCSLVYVAIIQFFISMFGDAGRLFSIVLLILQLTACAGTFPLELLPGFFKVLNPFMPFTYAVEAFREICSATVIDYSVILYDISILGIFFAVFLVGSIIFKHVGDRIIEAIEGKKEEAFENN